MRSKTADANTNQKEYLDKNGTLVKLPIIPKTARISAIHQVIFFGADGFDDRFILVHSFNIFIAFLLNIVKIIYYTRFIQ